jgi:hypothetical protein
MELPPKVKGRHRTNATHPITNHHQQSTDVHSIVLGDTGTGSTVSLLTTARAWPAKAGITAHPDCTAESITLSSDKQPEGCYVPREILIGMKRLCVQWASLHAFTRRGRIFDNFSILLCLIGMSCQAALPFNLLRTAASLSLVMISPKTDVISR